MSLVHCNICEQSVDPEAVKEHLKTHYTGASEPANVGRKDDQGKDRWDLVPWAAVTQVVKVLTFGANHYGDDNWRKVEGWRKRYFAAGCRHLTRWVLGERTDPATGLHHLAHAACCVLFLLELDV